MKKVTGTRFSSSFKLGAMALVFLIVGFQVALFVRQAAVSAVVAHRDRPDTVYVVDSALAAELLREAGMAPGAGLSAAGMTHADPVELGSSSGGAAGSVQRVGGGAVAVRRTTDRSPQAQALVSGAQQTRALTGVAHRGVESFRFDPNTVSVEDLIRLGFSRRQAQSIDNYRLKGGRFRRPSDFARSFVVADSVYERLKDFIDIPLVDINTADSAAFDALPGIGPYFASKMVQMREQLHGYSYPEQLMDIYNFDQERYDGLKDLITVSPPRPYPLWTLPQDSLALHPYIGRQCARGVITYRDNTPPDRRKVTDLESVLRPGMANRLSRCRIE